MESPNSIIPWDIEREWHDLALGCPRAELARVSMESRLLEGKSVPIGT